MLKRSRALASVAAIAILSGVSAPAWAETLKEALALAYQTNPSLLAQRASQRALDESIVQARAGLRPQLDVSANAGYSFTDSAGGAREIDTNGDGIPDTTVNIPASNSDSTSAGASLGLSQTIWSGGRIGHGISAAEANILAGRENLRDIEQTVLTSVIQAYADVIRDSEILRIRQSNLGVLQRQLDEASARFEVGEITRTDVAQSEARLAQSEADLANAQAQLSVSRAAYAAVVGQSPGDLAPMPVLPNLPADFDAALDVALQDNPGIRAAGYNLRAAEANVAAARAEYMPSARLTASYGGSTNDVGRPGDIVDNTSFQAGATISVPLFTGGLNSSRVAQALERANVAQINVEGERRNTLQSVSSAYAQSLSARSTLTAGQEAVRAATVAAEGVRQEAQVGLRTTLDVLNQELELRNAEVTLASARRNEYVAQANLLAAMGRLEGQDLDASIAVYDPAANYNRVRNRGALPWDGVIEAIDRIAAPPVTPANDAVDAPIDAQLKSEIVQTAPRD
ncbi:MULTISPECIES: TolC family outer membrane protein [unclassified Brevundimonas]|uniref:TolC family outer membrane protein n=1 Tax=unclassified Brevundimonas TaxID=2622653 RepID=UPI0006F321D5|nr:MULTISPECIES: TolC family outer membrane protein [unclassified Brevundimonas]KQY83488.1 type I secretion protein TolC [Brevundimonas sp. Root1423]KRA27043.1 type I secretion protein TolC [Brevundimonas sp. Root608]